MDQKTYFTYQKIIVFCHQTITCLEPPNVLFDINLFIKTYQFIIKIILPTKFPCFIYASNISPANLLIFEVVIYLETSRILLSTSAIFVLRTIVALNFVVKTTNFCIQNSSSHTLHVRFLQTDKICFIVNQCIRIFNIFNSIH